VTPAWIPDILAALMLVVAAVSAARLAAARPWRRDAVVVDTDVAHLLMAVAMAGMLAPSLATLPDTAWEVVFGLLAAWFAGRVLTDARRSGVRALAGGHCAPHLVHSGSMLYVFLAGSSPEAVTGGMGGMGGGPGSVTMALSHPTLALVFALVLVGYAIWDLDQLSGRRYATGARVSLAGAALDPDRAVLAVLAVRAADQHAAFQAGGDHASQMADGHAVQTAAGHAAASRDGGTACAGGPRQGGGGFLLSPAVTVGCRITMGITMAFMLLIAL
jgi:Domain of unknown function (DUF5134)